VTLVMQGSDLVLGYRDDAVVHGVSIRFEPGTVTALVGPNGSGKSTLLRSLARLHQVRSGSISIGAPGHPADLDVAALSARDFARRVTMLSQSRPQLTGLAVRDVVSFGRHPYRRRFTSHTEQDRQAVDRALALTGLGAMAERAVDQLSGGEAQRVWLAACLAQETGVLLLDEPTNHLDLRYQIETLDLMTELAADHGAALGVVLHDLNHAAAVADVVVLLHRGRVHKAGRPEDVLTAEHLSTVYGLPISTSTDSHSGRLRIEPLSRHHFRRVGADQSMFEESR
jgi:iron-chelate-transporting ATPase